MVRVCAVVFFELLMCGAFGADLVNFGPELCGDGDYRINGECVAKPQGRCQAGYYIANIDDNTYSSLTTRGYCMNSYNKVELPDGFSPIYNGIVVTFGPKLCGDGYYMVDGKCESRVQGNCPTDFYKVPINQGTFSAYSVAGQSCMNSYAEYEISDDFHMLYNGILVNFGPELCGEGMRMSDGGCVSVSRNDCPDNYYDILASEETIRKNNDAKCANGYSPYDLMVNCTTNTSEPLCAVLCNGDMAYTGVGTCATPCGHVIKTSTGLTIPLYSQSQITPSLNVKLDDGICFVNMVSGTQKGAINVSYGGSVYHLTD